MDAEKLWNEFKNKNSIDNDNYLSGLSVIIQIYF